MGKKNKVVGSDIPGDVTSTADAIIQNLPADENGIVNIPVSDDVEEVINPEVNAIQGMVGECDSGPENKLIIGKPFDNDDFKKHTDEVFEIINPDGTRSKPSESIIPPHKIIGERMNFHYESKFKAENIEVNELTDKNSSQIIEILLSKLNDDQKEFLSQFNDDLQRELLLRIEKERIEKERCIIEKWKLENIDLTEMNLKRLSQRLPQLARAAEKQGKHALAGEFHNLHNVASHALNQLNSLSEEALNFNPD